MPKPKPKPSSPITNDYERRKLAEQRATRRLKGDSGDKGKSGSKKRELKTFLTSFIISLNIYRLVKKEIILNHRYELKFG